MSATNGLSSRRILLVEDEVMIAWMLEDMLRQLGCVVVAHVSRVGEALTIIEAEQIDATVLDVNLNGEKSYPVAEALSARGVPFVFSTGYDRKSLPDCYSDRPLLQKPFKLSTLKGTLDELLNGISEQRVRPHAGGGTGRAGGPS